MMKLTWTLSMALLAGAEAATPTAGPSLICSDVPSRTIVTPTPSKAPSPLHFIRKQTSAPTSNGLCDGMLHSVSLIDEDSNEIIPILRNVNTLDLVLHTSGTYLRVNTEEDLDGVTITIDGTTFSDSTAPYIHDVGKALAGPGDHEISVEAVKNNHVGCFRDLLNGRMLPSHIAHYNAGWNAIKCKNECGNRGFAVAGTQYGGECWCGTLDHLQTAKDRGYARDQANCRQVCRSDPTQYCGAGAHNDVYLTEDLPVGEPCELQITTTYEKEDAICEGVIPNVHLQHLDSGAVLKSLTGDTFLNMMDYSHGFALAASVLSEYVDEVVFTIEGEDGYSQTTQAPYKTGFDFARLLAVPGNHEITVTALSNNHIGCFRDLLAGRMFPTHIAHYNAGWNAIKCKVECGKRGFYAAGTQYGGECWCGTKENLDNAIAQGWARAETSCRQVCRSDPTQYCGAGAHNDVYLTAGVDLGDSCSLSITTDYVTDNKICQGMIPSLSLVHSTTGDVIKPLQAGENILPMIQYPEGVSIVASANPKFIDGVKFSIGDEDSWEDPDAPFSAPEEFARMLAFPGTHEITVEPVTNNYIGCFEDLNPRMFPTHIAHYNAGWNAIKCKTECGNRGFPYAGSQYGGECWCGTEAQYNAHLNRKRDESQCSQACRSDSSQICGAGMRNSVYATQDIPVSASCKIDIKTVYPPDATCEGMVPSFSLVSAIDETEVVIADVKDGAIFDASEWPNGVFVAANAHRFVPSVRFSVDGLEVLDVSAPFEFRGVSAVLARPGKHNITMEVDDTNYVGCFRDLLAGRMFPVHIAHYNAGWNAIKCKVECGNRGYPFAGSQYGGECWCGTEAQFDNAVTQGYSRAEGNCMQVCRSDATQYCGAGSHNSVYRTAPVEVSPACRVEIETVYDNDSDECEGMIPSLALIDAGTDEVIEESIPISGYVLPIEDYPNGVTLRANTVLAPAVHFSVVDDITYSSDSTYPFIMSGVKENTDGSWDYDASPYLAIPGMHEISVRAVDIGYIGCFRDLLNGRMFPKHIAHYNAGWNALKCRDECGKQGYPYAGSQYGGECWCGSQQQLDTGKDAGYARGDESCNQKCRSDDSQYCGAGAHNSVYSTSVPYISDLCTTKITTVYEEIPACPGLVSSLTLVDAGTHQALRPLVDGMNITLAETSGMLTVRAHVVGNLHKAVKGVLFELDGEAKVDATAPYYLNGDFQGGTKFDPEPRMITPGAHTLTVYAQLLDDDYEDNMRHCTVNFFIESVDDGPCDGVLQSFSLINAESNGVVKILSNNDEIDIAPYTGGITVRANTITQNFQPIKFMITGPNGDLEVTSTYYPHSPSDVTILGNQVYDYGAADLLSLPGTHTIKAVALQTEYQGCFIDSHNRIFSTRLSDRYDVAECVKSCRDGGFPFAASQYKYECFCGTQEEFDAAESARTLDSECSLPCDRNSLMTCGGGWRNSVYGTEGTELAGEWCEAELSVVVGTGEGTCPGSIGSFSILVVGGGEIQTLNGFHFIMGGETYTFDMDQVPDSLTVRANVKEDVDEVRFYVNNTLTMIETTAPYVLGGKANFTDFIYKASVFDSLGTHTVKAVGVKNGVEAAESCEFTVVITNLPEEVEEPTIPVYDPHSRIDFLLLAEHKCKPVYVDGTVKGSSFFFKTLGEITNTTFDENVTFTTTNYFTAEEDVGNLDYMTTVYQDAETGEIVCDLVADVAVGSLGGEYVGKCDSGNFTYFEIYGFDEFFTADDNADTSDLDAACKPPAGATIGGVRKFTFAVPCDCTDLEDDSHDYGDSIPPGTLVANSWGDPHITTWDGAKFDCMGVGEFTMIKANLLDYEWHFGNNDYKTHTIELQMRYEFMDAFYIRDRLVSFGKGFVLKEKKTIQAVIAEEPAGKPKIGDCAIDFYVDGVRTDFLAGIDEDDLIVHPAGNYVYVFLPKTGVLVKLHIRFVRQGADGDIYTCSMSLYGGMPMNNPSIYNVRGLWGSPDGIEANDFTDYEGSVVPRPNSASQQYDYCSHTWCNRDPDLSIFKYEPGKTHRDYMHCDAYEWLGDYDLDELDDNSAYICNLLENADDIQQCKVDGLLGGFNQTLQAWLDIVEFNAMQSGTVQPPGDAEDACCSSNFADCHTGSLCGNIYTCNECVGREDPNDNLSDFNPWVWLSLGPYTPGSCKAQDVSCSTDAECCTTRGVCLPSGVCGVAEDNDGTRRRLEHAGFGQKAVPKSSRHATPYYRPMFK